MKKEIELGKTFSEQVDGKSVLMRCIKGKGNHDCIDCEMFGKECCLDYLCKASERSDNTHVLFVKHSDSVTIKKK